MSNSENERKSHQHVIKNKASHTAHDAAPGLEVSRSKGRAKPDTAKQSVCFEQSICLAAEPRGLITGHPSTVPKQSKNMDINF